MIKYDKIKFNSNSNKGGTAMPMNLKQSKAIQRIERFISINAKSWDVYDYHTRKHLGNFKTWDAAFSIYTSYIKKGKGSWATIKPNHAR